MPHSSGGGHHGGGHHSGGGHSSFSSHSSSRSYCSRNRDRDYYDNDYRYTPDRYDGPRISKTYFNGSTRYRYYSHGEEHYFYAHSSYRPWTSSRLILLIIYLPILAILGFFLFKNAQRSFGIFQTSDYSITDEANVLDSTAKLEKALSAFSKKAGITPAIVTITTNTWAKHSYSLSDYAYNRYVRDFTDENHWLLVYCADSNWAFEGMQGDNTDSVLTSGLTDEFNSTLYNYLKNGRDVSEAFAYSFIKINKDAKRPSFFSNSAPYLIALAFLCFHAYFFLGLNELKYKSAEPCPDTTATDSSDWSSVRRYPNGLEQSAFQSSGSQGYQPPYMRQNAPQNPMSKNDFDMPELSAKPALVVCPYCHDSYRATLPTCPHCGADFRFRN